MHEDPELFPRVAESPGERDERRSPVPATVKTMQFADCTRHASGPKPTRVIIEVRAEREGNLYRGHAPLRAKLISGYTLGRLDHTIDDFGAGGAVFLEILVPYITPLFFLVIGNFSSTLYYLTQIRAFIPALPPEHPAVQVPQPRSCAGIPS